MKWIIVSTNPTPHLDGTSHPNGAGWNIGDVFARLGTTQLIREVDPDAVIDLVNMDDPASITTPRDFDRAVFAGRPMFWEDCGKHTLWTELIMGWLCRDPLKVLALGVGDCFRGSGHGRRTMLLQAIATALKHFWKIVVRFPVDAPVIHSVCPAAWLLLGREEVPRVKLFNAMPGGGHYPEQCSDQAAIWDALVIPVAKFALTHGFHFVAHTQHEASLANALGWAADQIVFAPTIDPYLTAYASASHYVGNRMHGAVVLASRPAHALAIGYDSRNRMVDVAGLESVTPSELQMIEIRRVMLSTPGQHENDRIDRIAGEKKKMIKLLQQFAQ